MLPLEIGRKPRCTAGVEQSCLYGHRSPTVPAGAPGTARAHGGAGRQLCAGGVAGDAHRRGRSVPGSKPFRLVATEMGRGMNAVIEAEPVMELSCFKSIKSALYPAMSLEGDGEVTVTK